MQSSAIDGTAGQLRIPLDDASSQTTAEQQRACEQASAALVRSSWWIDLYREEMAVDATVSHKMVLLLRIIDACSDVGDKLVIFSSSVIALGYIEYFLKRGHSFWPFEPRCTRFGSR